MSPHSPSPARCLYDSVDSPVVDKFRWYLVRLGKSKKPYAFMQIGNKRMSMHRLLLNPPTGMEVDHVNGNGLDNRRENLRICTVAQNRQNSCGWLKRKCKYKGVSKVKRATGRMGGRPWEARICWDGRQQVIGLFDLPELAALAYDDWARYFHGRFACLNFPNPGERGLA